MGSKKVYSSDELFELVVEGFGDSVSPTAGQFRTWLQETRNIEVDYNKSRVAVERLKRNRTSGKITSPAKSASPAKTAVAASSGHMRHSRSHG